MGLVFFGAQWLADVRICFPVPNAMVLYVIGLGMGDEKDVTVKGLEAIRGCSRLYLEAYTSVLGVDQAKLEKFYGKPITIADRNFVELDADRIYSPALTEDIGFLVVGDPFCATTHSDLQLRAEAMGVEDASPQQTKEGRRAPGYRC